MDDSAETGREGKISMPHVKDKCGYCLLTRKGKAVGTAIPIILAILGAVELKQATTPITAESGPWPVSNSSLTLPSL